MKRYEYQDLCPGMPGTYSYNKYDPDNRELLLCVRTRLDKNKPYSTAC